jgi:hypothetical protein
MQKPKASLNKPIKEKEIKKEHQEKKQQRKDLQEVHPVRKELPVKRNLQVRKDLQEKKVNTAVRKKGKDIPEEKAERDIAQGKEPGITTHIEAITAEHILHRKLMIITAAMIIQAGNIREVKLQHRPNLLRKNRKKKAITK